MRVLRSPVALFLLIGTFTVVAIFLGTNKLADRAARQEAIAEAQGTTQVLADSVIGPDVPKGLSNVTRRKIAKADQMDRTVTPRLLKVETVDRVNIWTRDGRIVYSSDAMPLVGQRFGLDDDQLTVLENGGRGGGVADPDRPENVELARFRAELAESQGVSETDEAVIPDGGLVQTYTQIMSPEGEPLLLEAYYTLDEIEARSNEIFSAFRWITLGPLVLMILVATAILAGLTRQVRRGAQEEERLMRSAMDASDAERRRIARDLHDSVVQDLAGSAFAVSAVARNPETADDSRDTLEAAGTSLRTSLKSLRSLLAEIHPPDLHAAGLPAALSDLIASASTAGVQASVSVEGAETVSDDKAALVWRVAQEAVRNAIRHSQASTLAVTVNADGRRLILEVVDDGVGFNPAVVQDPHSYGLRGLRSLVVDNGGTLEVRSAPGEGTTVIMEVDAQ
ncbi:sensor histidine kinase [Nocardioides sp. SR21]|uniref:sensor histidine kinase n=1 Tax=Nocardioides sp. SR21 TaxID=2919501 RepID=UPI001FAAD55E|nr:sensor histidine kinase [Nocardioides sp. SR21]